MINELKDAIIKEIETIDNVYCEEYAGQLEGMPPAKIRTPGVLLHFGEMKPDDASGFGTELTLGIQISAFVMARHARKPNERAASVDALLEVALTKIHNVNFIEGCTMAKLTKIVPNFMLEQAGISIREIRWNQAFMLGEPVFTGATSTTMVFNGEELTPGT